MFRHKIALMATLMFAATMAFAVTARAAGTITACGKISQSGVYSIQPHATLQSSGGDCLVVTAPNVTIQTQVADIEGHGSGAGIHIMSTATAFVLQPFSTTINHFNIGIQDDANGAYIGSDYGAPLWIGDQVNTAIFLNGVIGSSIWGAGMHAVYNGILIRGGRNNVVTGYATQLASQGQSSGGPTECCWEVIASNGDGVRIEGGSTGNHIYQADVTKAASDGAGIHVTGQSSGTLVAESGIASSGTGIRVESGAAHNFILNNATSSNTLDLKDVNPNCGSDVWSGNQFKTADPSSCIH